MKATLEYTLPEERDEHAAAVNASRVLADLEDLSNDLRSFTKHDVKPDGFDADMTAIGMAVWVRKRIFEITGEK